MSKIFVSGIGQNANQKDIEDIFGGHGSINRIEMKDNYCFVEFSDERDAQEVMSNPDNYKLNDQQLKVEWAKGGKDGGRGGDRRGGGRGGRGGGRGRDDRGGDRGGDRGCFKCGEQGHFARDCPTGGDDDRPRGGRGGRGGGRGGRGGRGGGFRGGDRGGDRGCFKCGEQGHFARDCPKGGDDGDRPRRGRGGFRRSDDDF